eukprot:COSAG01_NODE_2426_length_7722_cov_2.700905_12_plen_98_part_00
MPPHRQDRRTRAAVEPEAARFAQRLVHPGAADRAARHRLALARLPLQHSSMMVARHRRHTGESQAHRGRRRGGQAGAPDAAARAPGRLTQQQPPFLS